LQSRIFGRPAPFAQLRDLLVEQYLSEVHAQLPRAQSIRRFWRIWTTGMSVELRRMMKICLAALLAEFITRRRRCEDAKAR
jgi:hypothetical protein